MSFGYVSPQSNKQNSANIKLVQDVYTQNFVFVDFTSKQG